MLWMPCRYNTFDGRLIWFDGVEGKRGLTLTGLFVVVLCVCVCVCVGVGVFCCFFFFFWGGGGAGGGSNCFIV